MKPKRRRSKSKPTSLKRTKRGYTRNLGRKADGSQPKFYLGHDREQAVLREKRLVALWHHIEKWVGMPEKIWTPEYLEAARAIAKGETPEIPAGRYEIPDEYVTRINELAKEMGGEAISRNEGVYEWGVEQLESDIELANKMLARTPGATGQTLHEAIAAFQEYIEKEYVDSDGTISDNGKSKWRQVKALSDYIPDMDLGELDFEKVDEISGVFRRRPISRRYGTRMTPKSCKNYIGDGQQNDKGKWIQHTFYLGADENEAKRRLMRLDEFWDRNKTDKFDWRKPLDFDELETRVPETADDRRKKVRPNQVDTYGIDELKLLNEYATPLERVLFLLGLT